MHGETVKNLCCILSFEWFPDIWILCIDA